LRLTELNRRLRAAASEPFGPGSRTFPGYGGCRWRGKIVLAVWNHGHGNWNVDCVQGGYAYGLSIEDAIDAMNGTPVSYRTVTAAADAADV